MINRYLDQIRSALDSLQVHRVDSYLWCGVRHRVLPPRLLPLLTEDDIRSSLISAIENRLYRDFYCVGGIRPESEKFQAQGSHAATQQFVRALSDANNGADHFDPDWCVLSISDRSLTIMKDGLRLTADLTDCQSDFPIVQGGFINLRTSKECLAMTPGFYLVLASAPGAVRGSANNLIRLYWNVTSVGAVKLIDELTRHLNARAIPFRLKALRDPSTYVRCDAVVLYLSKQHFKAVWDILSRTYRILGGDIKQAIPSMTKQIAPGLGLAEDPQRATSFGLHRCNLIARGLLHAWETKDRHYEQRLNHVIDAFAQEGLEVSRPYLNSGSQDDYPTINVQSYRAQRTARRWEIDSGACLEAAVAIGNALRQSAMYSKDTCTWAGYRLAHPHQRGSPTRIFGTVGPHLYDGCAGIGWFLSELYGATKDDAIGSCAAAALSGAVLAASTLPTALFAGWVGISLSAAYCADLLGCSDLRDSSIELLNLLEAKEPLATGPDLLSGCAGVISALVLQSRLLHDDELLKLASARGERLIEAAEANSSVPGLSWRSNRSQKHANLTGLSHGASGAVLGLSQLFRATRRAAFRDCARQAILYERALFDSEHQNWPDLRGVPRSNKRPSRKYKFSQYWCHGAPGIGVSRLAAWRHLKMPDCLDEARIAFRSTYAWTSRAATDGQSTGCLCHGVLGNALILWYAAEMLADRKPSYKDLALATGSEIARKVLDKKVVFSETPQDIDNPTLMLGLAGIGHYLLRIAAGTAPMRLISPLWLE